MGRQSPVPRCLLEVHPAAVVVALPRGVFPSAWAEHGAGAVRTVLSHGHPCPAPGQLGRWLGSSYPAAVAHGRQVTVPSAPVPGRTPAVPGRVRCPPSPTPCNVVLLKLTPNPSRDPNASTLCWSPISPASQHGQGGMWLWGGTPWTPGSRAPGTRSVSGPEETGPYTSWDPPHLRPHRPQPHRGWQPHRPPRNHRAPRAWDLCTQTPQASPVQDPRSLQPPCPIHPSHPVRPRPSTAGTLSVPCSSDPTHTTSHTAQTWTWVPYTPHAPQRFHALYAPDPIQPPHALYGLDTEKSGPGVSYRPHRAWALHSPDLGCPINLVWLRPCTAQTQGTL